MTKSMHYGTFNTKDDTIIMPKYPTKDLLYNNMGLGSTRSALG